jgi:hypothetical protein
MALCIEIFLVSGCEVDWLSAENTSGVGMGRVVMFERVGLIMLYGGYICMMLGLGT